jgi:hypothetical protein
VPDSTVQADTRQRVKELEQTLVDLKDAIALLVDGMLRAGVHVSFPTHLKKYVGDLLPAASQSLCVKVHEAKESAHAASEEADAQRVPAQRGLTGATALGEAARMEWVRSGEIVPAKALSDSWGLTPKALGSAGKRGELFALTLRKRRYYPSEFLKLDRNDVAAVCKQLKGLDPAEQLVFWKRKHGSLGGKTVFDVLSTKQSNRLVKVVQLARALTAQNAGDKNALLDQTYFALSAAQVTEFQRVVEAPLSNNTSLAELLATRAPWE